MPTHGDLRPDRGSQSAQPILLAMYVKEQRRHLLGPQAGVFSQSIMGHQHVLPGRPRPTGTGSGTLYASDCDAVKTCALRGAGWHAPVLESFGKPPV